MKGEYTAGDFIVIKSDDDEIQFEIVESGNLRIKLRDKLTGILSDRKVSEINELIYIGQADYLPRDVESRALNADLSIDFSTLPDELKGEAKDRYKFVREILALELKSHSENALKPYVENIFNENEFSTLQSPPSARSVIRWKNKYIKAGGSIRALVSNHANKGNTKPKTPTDMEAYIAEAIRHFKKLERPTIASSYEHLETLVDYDNEVNRGDHNKLKVISKSAFVKRLEKEAPKKLMEARHGKEAANKAFRQKKLPQEINSILQRVEADHTKLDLFIVDTEANLILGRPWVTALLDYRSKSVLGFYIGFEYPSYLSITRALKHAIQPKTYVKKQYPSVQNQYHCYGIMLDLVVDRGKDFESVLLEDACDELSITIKRNPGKHPWYKGSIESYFKTVNKKLLDNIPGKVFSDIVDSNEYNPEKNAVIGMADFMELFHIWLIDIYHQDKVSGGTLIPKVTWEEDRERIAIRTANKDFLDIVFSENMTRMNNKDGIVVHHIYYDSPELLQLRQETGFSKVTLKFDREDLGYIYVLDTRSKRQKKFIKVPAVDFKYANGLSLHQHKIILHYNKKYLDDQRDPGSLAIAKMKIQQIIERALTNQKNKKITSNQKIARFMNVGQQSDSSVKVSVLSDKGSSETNYEGIPIENQNKAPKQHIQDINSIPEPDYSKDVLPSSLNIKKR